MYIQTSFCVHINNRNQSSENPKMRFCLWILGLFHSHWHRISIESDWNMSLSTYYSTEYMKMQIKEREMRSKREEKKSFVIQPENVRKCVCSVLFFLTTAKCIIWLYAPMMAFTYISFQWLTNSKSDTKEKKRRFFLWIVWQRFRNKSPTNWIECLDLE